MIYLLARMITAVNRACFSGAKWLVYAIALLMIYEVFARYSLQAPTSWAPELAALIFGPFFLMAGPYLLHTGGHVAVDLLSEHARGAAKIALACVGLALAALFGFVLLWFGLPLAVQSFQYGETSYSTWNPVIWPAKMFVPLAAALLILQALAEFIFAIFGDEAH